MSDESNTEVQSLLLEHDEEPEIKEEPQLSREELIELRWMLFGKCPICRANVHDWEPGPFNPGRYRELDEKDIDPLSGHIKTCNEKWRRH